MNMKLPLLFVLVSPWLASVPALAQTSGFGFRDTAGDHLDVTFNGKAVVRYQYAFDRSTPERLQETYKPYLHVLDAAGREPITKGAGGEFTHHRGLFAGWNKLMTSAGVIDRWHMKGGNIVHQKVLEQRADQDSASVTALIHWQGSGEAPALEERRTYTVLRAPAPAYVLVELKSELKALDGEVQLDGDPEHAGIQFRPAISIDRSQTRYVYPKAQAEPHKDLDYPWVAQRITVDQKRYTVAFLNHPQNPTQTRFSAYRDYGRFGGFFRATIPAGESRTLRVRLLVAEGDSLSAEQIQKAANAFSGQEAPVPAVTEVAAEAPAPKKPAAAPADKASKPVSK